MTLTFFSLDKAPRNLPLWHLILGDLGNPPPQRIAKVLGVGVRTVYRWNRLGVAPRSACLALFWLTRWGRSQVNCDAVNDCTLAVQYSTALRTELASTRAQLAAVMALVGTSGAGGEPPVSRVAAWPELEKS
jgi:hypothetical protein